jgi:flavin-dependent dehydrogenase
MKNKVVIVGGGPGGSATALYLAQVGIPCTVIEKTRFPRYHIGESLTGEAGNCLRTVGLEMEMKARGHPIKHGVWVYGPNGKNSFWVPVKGWTPERGQFNATTWSVPRSDFDQMLKDGAAARGAHWVEGDAVELIRKDDAVRGVRVRLPGGAVEDFESDVLVDASGQATFLYDKGVIGPKSRGNYDKQVAVFSQVTGAIRDPGEGSGNTLIFYQKKHHWAWFIPLDNEVTSVGVVVPTEYFRSRNESKEDFLIREAMELNPGFTRRLEGVRWVEETRGISNYSYHIKHFTGNSFLCVGDSHRFIDPVFSFGVFFSMKEGQFAASAIKQYLDNGCPKNGNPFANYERLCEHGQDVVQDMIDAFWEEPFAFAFAAHKRYTEDIIDIFAGRVYREEVSPGLRSLRKTLAKSRMRNAASTAATA